MGWSCNSSAYACLLHSKQLGQGESCNLGDRAIAQHVGNRVCDFQRDINQAYQHMPIICAGAVVR